MRPVIPISIKKRFRFIQSHRNIKYLRFKKVLKQLKWEYKVNQYKLLSRRRRMTFAFKKAMLSANYITVLFLKHHIITKERSTIMIPSSHNPYKSKPK